MSITFSPSASLRLTNTHPFHSDFISLFLFHLNLVFKITLIAITSSFLGRKREERETEKGEGREILKELETIDTVLKTSLLNESKKFERDR